MPVNLYRGMTVRITRGKGAGQERPVISNTLTILTVSPNWEVTPDATQLFRDCRSPGGIWVHRGRAARYSLKFQTVRARWWRSPGRAANVNDQEAPYELSTVTRCGHRRRRRGRWRCGCPAGAGIRASAFAWQAGHDRVERHRIFRPDEHADGAGRQLDRVLLERTRVSNLLSPGRGGGRRRYIHRFEFGWKRARRVR